MFITILIGIVFLVALVSFLIGLIIETEKGLFFSAFGVATAIGSILLFFSTYTLVGATQVGVPVAFGKVSEPLDPGVHFVAPWYSVEEYPTRPITVSLDGQHKIIARTADAGQMSVEIAVRWRVEKHDAKVLYFQSRSGDMNYINETIIVPNIRQAVGQVYSVTGNLDAISDRERVAEHIRTQMNKQLLVTYGITIDSVQMRSVEPDGKTATTISLYNSQQQATRIAEEAKKTAVVEAERRLIEAKGLEVAGKSIANLTPTQLQVLCMQVWQQVNSTAISHNATLYTQPCGNSTGALIVNTK